MQTLHLWQIYVLQTGMINFTTNEYKSTMQIAVQQITSPEKADTDIIHSTCMYRLPQHLSHITFVYMFMSYCVEFYPLNKTHIWYISVYNPWLFKFCLSFSQPHNLLEWFYIGMDVLMNSEVLMLMECLATTFIVTLYRKNKAIIMTIIGIITFPVQGACY